MNRNYITIAVIAVLLAIIIGFLCYNKYEENERNKRWQESAIKNGERIKEKLNDAWGKNDGINSIFEDIKVINVNGNDENEE